MYRCPHCNETITDGELFSRRFLQKRNCRVCEGGYIEGGSTSSVGIMAAAGAIVTSLNGHPSTPTWSYYAVFGLAATATIAVIRFSQPRRSEEFRMKMLEALVISPLVATVVWGGIALIEFAAA